MPGAAFHTGSSKQDYATPREFIDAVKQGFGPIVWDLAAVYETRVTSAYFGPDHEMAECRDAFTCNWATETNAFGHGLLWLNPPFDRIAPWAEKCARESQDGAEILFLVPASVGANWFWDWVAPWSKVYALSPRLSFDGKNSYPKDLILAHYKLDAPRGFERWCWKL